MSFKPHKKALVFFSAGVGDAILLVPLVNALKRDGIKVTALFTSSFNCETIFENTELFDDIKIKKSKLSRILFSIFHFRKFDQVYLNHFAFSNFNLSIAAIMGKNVFTNYNGMKTDQSSKSIHFIDCKANTHDALQHLLLYKSDASLSDLNFNLNYRSYKYDTLKLNSRYIVIQPGSANNKAPYKNWPVENWLALIKFLQDALPNTQLVVMGDKTELEIENKLQHLFNKNTISLIGKTTLADAMAIIHQSQLYIGLDSGLMHMAVALKKPTFTIWGASDPILYGYKWMGEQHELVTLNLSCAPCSVWINPNTIRVFNPLLCPDFMCVRDLSSQMVIEKLKSYFNTINFKDALSSGNAE